MNMGPTTARTIWKVVQVSFVAYTQESIMKGLLCMYSWAVGIPLSDYCQVNVETAFLPAVILAPRGYRKDDCKDSGTQERRPTEDPMQWCT